MGKIKPVDHTTIRNKELFCLHCGGTNKIIYPIGIKEMTEKINDFNKLHAKCKKTWQQPMAVPTWPAHQKISFWLEHGERGLSSETICQSCGGVPLKSRGNHPLDVDDFKRCYNLLQMVPELKNKLDQLSNWSVTWEKLVNNWDELTQLYEAKKYEEVYKLMKTCGC